MLGPVVALEVLDVAAPRLCLSDTSPCCHPLLAEHVEKLVWSGRGSTDSQEDRGGDEGREMKKAELLFSSRRILVGPQ